MPDVPPDDPSDAPPHAPPPGLPLLVLVGPAGAGKSAVAARVARSRGAPVIDTDAAVVERDGRSVPEIFAADGEPAFRALESDAVADALASDGAVVSLGGGAVLDDLSRRALRRVGAAGVPVVHLQVGWRSVSRRLRGGQGRPLLAGDARAAWTALARARAPLYAEVATAVVSTDGRWPRQVATEVSALLPS